MSAVLIALMDGWTPVHPNLHRAIPANEIRDILTAAKKRK